MREQRIMPCKVCGFTASARKLKDGGYQIPRHKDFRNNAGAHGQPVPWCDGSGDVRDAAEAC